MSRACAARAARALLRARVVDAVDAACVARAAPRAARAHAPRAVTFRAPTSTSARTFASSANAPKRPGRARVDDDANADFAKYLFALVVSVVGATYASVPLYRMFCQATGFGGTTRRATLEDKLKSEAWSDARRDEASGREITIYFNADVAEGMPWRFTPTQKSIKVRPGESALAFYTAKNLTKTPVTGVATYNVQPNKCGAYFNKVQCFCFEEQRLRGKEEVDMPVLFYIDPEFASDPNMRDVKSLILSYTFFKSDDFEDDVEEDDGKSSGVRVHGPGVVAAS